MTHQAPIAKSRFVRDVILVFIANGILNLKTLIIIPIITKKMGALNYGLWAQAIVTFNVFVPIITLGLGGALTRFLTGERDPHRLRMDLYGLLTVVGTSGVAFGLLLFAAARPVADAFFASNLHVVLLVALSLPVHCLAIVLYSYLRAMRRTMTYAVVLVSEPLIHIGLVYAIVVRGGTIELILLTYFALRLLAVLVMLALVVIERGFARPGFRRMREFLTFSLPYVPANIFAWLMGQGDRFIISLFLGVIFVGFYAPAASMGMAITYFVLPIEFALFPIVTQLYDERDHAQVQSYLQLALRIFLAAALPSLVGLVMLGRPLLLLFTTPQISEHGYLAVPFVTLGATIYGVNVILSQIINLIKKTHIVAVAAASAATVSLGLNLYLVPRYGIAAAAVTYCLAMTIHSAIVGVYGLRRFPLAIEWNRLARLAGATLLIVPVLLWPLLTGRHLLPAIAVAVLVYAGGVLGFGVLRPRELRLLFGALPGARS